MSASFFSTKLDIDPFGHFATTFQPEYLLITGYFRFILAMNHSNGNNDDNINNASIIPSNILTNVTNYYGLDYGLRKDESLNLLSILNTSPTSQLKLLNVNHMKAYNVHMTNINNAHTKHHSIFGLDEQSKQDKHDHITTNPSICSINNTSIPIPFQTMLTNSKNITLSSYHKMNNNIKASMVIFIGGTRYSAIESKSVASIECNICAFPALHSALQISEKHRDDKQIINAFNFTFPSLPQPMCGLSTIYDKYHNKIYTMNPWNKYSTNIWCCDLNVDQYKDLKWKSITNKLQMSRSNTSICMVDRGRFIAIMGGKGRYHHRGIQTKGMELYSEQCDKSIKLSLMNRFSENGASVYNEELHNIVVGDSIGFQLYDINKDEWYHLYDRYYNTLDNKIKPKIWISDTNPFIVYLSGYKKIKCQCKWTGEIDIKNYCVERFDIREYRKKPILRLRDVSWESLAHYNELIYFDENVINTNNTKVASLAF